VVLKKSPKESDTKGRGVFKSIKSVITSCRLQRGQQSQIIGSL
jgi:hypothetical protein